jgi:hypothetical protein
MAATGRLSVAASVPAEAAGIGRVDPGRTARGPRIDGREGAPAAPNASPAAAARHARPAVDREMIGAATAAVADSGSGPMPARSGAGRPRASDPGTRRRGIATAEIGPRVRREIAPRAAGGAASGRRRVATDPRAVRVPAAHRFVAIATGRRAPARGSVPLAGGRRRADPIAVPASGRVPDVGRGRASRGDLRPVRDPPRLGRFPTPSCSARTRS